MSIQDFRDQFAQAAGIATEAEEAPAEEAETAEEIQQEEVVEQNVTEGETNELVVEETPALLAGKYESPAQLEAAYLEAQKKIGEQGNELGSLRQLSSEVEALREQLAPAPQLSYDPGSVDEYIAENPQQIPALAQQALEANDGYLYPRAMAAWSELDPVGAMDFHARAVSRAEMAQLRAEMAPALQGMQQAQVRNEFADAFEAKTREHPDFAQVMNAVTPETIAGFPPEVIAALQTGDAESKSRVLETLYRWTKSEQAGNVTEAATQVALQTQQDGRTARQEAAVATTSTSQAREVTTGIDAFREQFQASDAFRKAAGLA